MRVAMLRLSRWGELVTASASGPGVTLVWFANPAESQGENYARLRWPHSSM